MPHSTLSAAPAPAPSSGRLGAELAAGRRLGRYQLVTRLARGGMADLWVARQMGALGFSRIVAVKTIRPEFAGDRSFRAMFLDEARIACRIRHVNVVEVLDLGVEDDVLFQVMTLIDGESLRSITRACAERGRILPLPTAVRLLLDVLAGLHAAHELTDDEGRPLAIVHRDVSPQNVLVGVDGSVKLGDFGIAKALGRAAEETETGQLKGKVAYLTPEQIGRRAVDRRTDVCAAGIVLWECVTGAPLFRGDDLLDTLARATSWQIPDPCARRPGVPRAIGDVVLRALARDPGERFATAAAMADALERAAEPVGIASGKQVAEIVEGLVGARIAARREAVRAALRGEPAPAAVPLSSDPESAGARTIGAAVVPAPSRGSGRRVAMAVVGGAIVAATIAVSLARRASPHADTNVAALAETAAPAPATSAPKAEASVDPAPAGSADAARSAPADPSPTRSRHDTRAAAAHTAKFPNPY